MLTKKELLLISTLLELASERFSNHGCNDYYLQPLLTEDECIELDKFLHEWNGDPEEHNPDWAKDGQQMDWFLMSYLSDRCKEESNKL
jgi:hypothetical protein